MTKKNLSLNYLPKEHGSKHSQYWIVLIKDLGDYALYLNKTSDICCGYEVHKIRIKEPETIYGIEYPKRRVIASTSEFGRYAWAYPNKESVLKAFPQFKGYF